MKLVSFAGEETEGLRKGEGPSADGCTSSGEGAMQIIFPPGRHRHNNRGTSEQFQEWRDKKSGLEK